MGAQIVTITSDGGGKISESQYNKAKETYILDTKLSLDNVMTQGMSGKDMGVLGVAVFSLLSTAFVFNKVRSNFKELDIITKKNEGKGFELDMEETIEVYGGGKLDGGPVKEVPGYDRYTIE